MDVGKIKGNIDPTAPVHSTRIRVGRSIDGFGLSPGITKEQRLGVEKLMSKAFANLTGDLAGTYYPLTGMNEQVRQQLVDDHFLFVSGDPNLKVAGMERDWPEGRGIFHNKAKICQFKLVLLGESAVGKSSLVLRFVKGQFHEFQESTIGAAFLTQTVCLDDTTVKFEIWDTA